MTMDPVKGMLKEIHFPRGKLFSLLSPLHAQPFSGKKEENLCAVQIIISHLPKIEAEEKEKT